MKSAMAEKSPARKPARRRRGAVAAGVAVATLVGGVTYNAVSMPESGPAEASACQTWTVPGNGPAWMRQRDNGQCGDPENDKRVHQCLVAIGGGTAFGFFGLPWGPFAGALSGGLACGAQWIN